MLTSRFVLAWGRLGMSFPGHSRAKQKRLKDPKIAEAVRHELIIEFRSLQPDQAFFSLEAARQVFLRAGIPELAEIAINQWHSTVR